MVVAPKRRKARAGVVTVECPHCHEAMDKRILKQHNRFVCQGIPRNEDEGVASPGTIIGSGLESHKKAWTWTCKEFVDAWPRETWVTQVPNSNPPGGITWQGLHIELIPGRQGCFMTYGPRPGFNAKYAPAIPPPHWNIYLDSLKADVAALRALSDRGEPSIAMPVVAGALERQYVMDTETGLRHELIVNPDGTYEVR